jgi:calpain
MNSVPVHNSRLVYDKRNDWCFLFSDTFANNPQYHIQLRDADPYDDDQLCTVIIAVLQKHRREQKHIGLDTLPVGFAVYEVWGNLTFKMCPYGRYRTHSFLQ